MEYVTGGDGHPHGVSDHDEEGDNILWMEIDSTKVEELFQSHRNVDVWTCDDMGPRVGRGSVGEKRNIWFGKCREG